MVEPHVEFHEAIAIASRNAILRRFLEQLAKQFRWRFAAVASARSKASWREHEEDAGGDRGRRSGAGGTPQRLAQPQTRQVYIEQFLATADKCGTTLND